MTITRRQFISRVAQAGGYGAAFMTMHSLGLFGMVAIGFLFTRLTLIERAAAFIAALCLLGDFGFSDAIGFTLSIACVVWQWRQRRRVAVAAV